jgi:hypothetical protein
MSRHIDGMATCRTLLAASALSVTIGLPAMAAPDLSAARPGDDAMSCEQIATELVPYMRQLQPNLQALGTATQQLAQERREKGKQRQAEHELLTPLATAGALDPTGASKRAYVAAEMAQAAKERGENEAMANSPLAKEVKSRNEQFAAQGQELQSNARLQRLMQLGTQKGCTRR